MALLVHQVAVGGFDNNFSYVIADTVSRQACIVDPSGDFAPVARFIETNDCHIVGILLTHTHHDHFDQLAVARQLTSTPIPIYVCEAGVSAVADFTAIQPVTDGMEVPLGSGHIHVIHTPGHCDDAVCFYITAEAAQDNIPKVITGDTLFVGGCGRTTELRVKDLYESLQELAHLPDETIVYPGHDYGDTPTSTIAREKTTNRFYQVKNFNDFKRLRLG